MTATGQGRLPPSVTLRPMSTEQFEEWQGRSIRSYADDLAKATGWPLEASLNKARKQFAELLPAGMGTDRTWILLIVDETGVEVGTLWVGPNSERAGVAFVYDIEIEEEQRGLGFDKAAMIAVESLVREAGETEIGLNVFGFNEQARNLYDSLGYRVVATVMTKTIKSRLHGE
jgi:ribosomal protein S18 acetylase RimI-like enzyme